MARTRKTVVILISGKAGAGKTTIGELMIKKLKDTFSMDVMEYGFADPIKYIAEAYGGWNKEKDERGRSFLQNIGRVWRDYDQDIWVKHFLRQLDNRAGMFPKNFAVIDDWRFPNEVDYLKKNPMLDIVTIRVFGRHAEMPDSNWADVSETSLTEFSFEWLWPQWDGFYNFSIDNSGSIDELNTKADIILSALEKQYIVE
jgi:hypothetical protein